MRGLAPFKSLLAFSCISCLRPPAVLFLAHNCMIRALALFIALVLSFRAEARNLLATTVAWLFSLLYGQRFWFCPANCPCRRFFARPSGLSLNDKGAAALLAALSACARQTFAPGIGFICSVIPSGGEESLENHCGMAFSLLYGQRFWFCPALLPMQEILRSA